MSRSRSLRAVRRVARGAVVASSVLWLGPRLAQTRPPPRPPDAIRLVSYNLRNFPVRPPAPGDLPDTAYRRDPPHDTGALAADLEHLSADVLALQEIVQPQALDDLLDPQLWARAVTSSGGARDQHLVIAWRRGAFARVGPPRQLDEVSVTPALRPGLAVRLRHRVSGRDFFVVAVHLKSGQRGAGVRRVQWSAVIEVVAALKRVDPDVIVVGDFNVAGGDPRPASATPSPEPDTPQIERAALEQRLAEAGLRPFEVGECTAYWEGVRRDGWLEPSRLDLAFAAGFEDLGPRARRGFAAGPCWTHRCRPLRSTAAHPDPAAAGRSDHCPVVIDIPARH